jgi:hypothetical protein
MSPPLTAVLPLAYYLEPDESPARREVAPALTYFAAATFDEAMRAARAVYLSARHCPRCHRVLAQRFDRLGSALFRDDDPRKLAASFDRADRDGCTVRLLAACVVLFARDRESLH